jgi:hypothetical protein
MSVIPATWEAGIVQGQPQAKSTRPYLKNKLKQKGLGTWLVIENLSSKCKALNSNPSPIKSKNKKSTNDYTCNAKQWASPHLHPYSRNTGGHFPQEAGVAAILKQATPPRNRVSESSLEFIDSGVISLSHTAGWEGDKVFKLERLRGEKKLIVEP